MQIFFTDQVPFCHPTNSVKALKGTAVIIMKAKLSFSVAYSGRRRRLSVFPEEKSEFSVCKLCFNGVWRVAVNGTGVNCYVLI